MIGDSRAFQSIQGLTSAPSVGWSGQTSRNITVTNSLPYVQIDIPSEIWITTNGRITAELNPLTALVTPEMKAPPQIIASSSVFDVAGPAHPSGLSWSWDVFPKAIGSHRTITIQLPPFDKFDFKFDSASNSNISVNGNTVNAVVDIRDELGLTQAERTLLTAFGAICGILGTLFGYPFLKTRLEPKATLVTALVPPSTGSRNLRKPRRRNK